MITGQRLRERWPGNRYVLGCFILMAVEPELALPKGGRKAKELSVERPSCPNAHASFRVEGHTCGSDQFGI